MTRTLYLFAGAAPPVFDVARVIEDAQVRGWEVCLGLTPTAARWLEPSLDGLAALTGRPVRHEYPLPGLPEVWPPADVILVAPATFNTINGWALGLTGTFVTGVLAESIGKRVPTVAMPSVSAALMQHPQFERSLETLRAAGVTVLFGEAGAEPAYPWQPGLAAAEAAAG